MFSTSICQRLNPVSSACKESALLLSLEVPSGTPLQWGLVPYHWLHPVNPIIKELRLFQCVWSHLEFCFLSLFLTHTQTHTHTHTLCVQHQWLNPGHNPANVRHILTSFQWNFKRFHIWTMFLHSVCVSNAHKNLLCTLTAHSRVFIEECPYIGVGGGEAKYDMITIRLQN